MQIKKIESKKIHPRDALNDIDKNLALTEFKKEAHKIAKAANVKITDVKINYHYMVDEYCIYINGVWSGYLEDWQ